MILIDLLRSTDYKLHKLKSDVDFSVRISLKCFINNHCLKKYEFKNNQILVLNTCVQLEIIEFKNEKHIVLNICIYFKLIFLNRTVF